MSGDINALREAIVALVEEDMDMVGDLPYSTERLVDAWNNADLGAQIEVL